MSPRSEPYSSRRDTVTFVACLVLAVAARLAPAEVTDPIASGLRETLLAPFLSLQSRTELARTRRVEFATFLAERDSAVAMAGRVFALEQENQRLRSILGLRSRMPVHHVAAEVLHQLEPSEDMTLMLSVGERDGVHRWAPVVAVGGLVGNVQQVDRETAIAMTWTHPEFRASATALDDLVVGMLAPRAGEGRATLLELSGVSFSGEIPDGTTVYTSGSGGVYPARIPVGWIRGALDEREDWSRSFLVEPAVHPSTVSHVLVLLAEAESLSSAFERP